MRLDRALAIKIDLEEIAFDSEGQGMPGAGDCCESGLGFARLNTVLN